MDIIDINQLNDGLPTITKTFCDFFVEAIIFCLQHNSHKSSKCELDCIKDIKDNAEKYQLIWKDLDPRAQDTYGDLDEATEYGATGLAILLSIKLSKYSTVSRSMKGGGFDYWLGDKEGTLFQKKARLEISGILKGNETQFKSRIKQKIKQTNVSDNLGYNCYISVVEFSKPQASFLSKEGNHD